MFVSLQIASAQTYYTWNGNTSPAFNVATNWTPNGVPTSNDNITIVTASRTCTLTSTTTVKNLTLTSGTFDLGGYTLNVGGTTAIFTMGTIQNGTLTISGATTTTFGSSNVTMNCSVNVTSAFITMTKTTFQNALTLVKTGSSNDASAGGNTFNGITSMTNSGAGYLLLGNGSADIWNNNVTFTNTGSERILLAWTSVGNQFNGNIYVNTSGNAQGIQFCGGNNTATALLASGKTIQAGSGGLTAGYLYL